MGTIYRILTYSGRQLGGSPPMLAKVCRSVLALSPERRGFLLGGTSTRVTLMLNPAEFEISDASNIELVELGYGVPG